MKKESKKRKKSATKRAQKRLRAETGRFSLEGAPAELVVQRAQEVVEAMARLPPSALDKEAVRRNLSVVTDGEVGGYKFKLKKGAKRNAFIWFKRNARDLGRTAVTAAVAKAVEELVKALARVFLDS